MVKGASTTAPPPGQGWYIPRWELHDEYLRRGYVVNTHTTSVSPGPERRVRDARIRTRRFLDRAPRVRVARRANVRRLHAPFVELDDALRRRRPGWIAPRDADGAFMHTAIDENGQSGFQEGNAAQYTWMVPAGSARLGRRDGRRGRRPSRSSTTFFTQLNAGQDKPYAWLGNEPSLGAPWVYLSRRRAVACAERSCAQALTTLYGDTPDGLPGNDDLGTMSAWYIWCAIGLYPQNPAVRYSRRRHAALHRGNDPRTRAARRSRSHPRAAPTPMHTSKRCASTGARAIASWLALPLRGIGPARRFGRCTGRTPRWASAAVSRPAVVLHNAALALPPSTRRHFDPTRQALDVDGRRRSAAVEFANLERRGQDDRGTVEWRRPVPNGLHWIVAARSRDACRGRVGGVARAPFAPIRRCVPATTTCVSTPPRANGAPIEHLVRHAYASLAAGERPSLAYAENRFGNTITPDRSRDRSDRPEIRRRRRAARRRARPRRRNGSTSQISAANSISVVDTIARRERSQPSKSARRPTAWRSTPDGKTLWMANGDDGTIQSIDTATLTAGTPIRVGTPRRAPSRSRPTARCST